MAGRYEQLQKSSECLYTIGSPVVISAMALLKDTQTGSIIAQVKFQSIFNHRITAVFADFAAKDISGASLAGVENFQYLDLHVGRNDNFGAKTAVNLPDSNTRKFKVKINRVVFSDNTTWEAPSNATLNSIVMCPIVETLGNTELVEQYKRDTVKSATYIPEEISDLWVCTCGILNRNTENKCYSCRLEKEKAFSAFNKEILQSNLDAYNEKMRIEADLQQAERDAEAEKQRIKREKEEKRQQEVMAKQKKIIKKVTIIGTPIISMIITFFVVLNTVIIPSSNYSKAEKLLVDRKYDEAYSAFVDLKNYKNAQEMAKKSCYEKALALVENEKYEEAIPIFETLAGYEKSQDIILQCNLALGMLAAAEINPDKALEYFEKALQGSTLEAARETIYTFAVSLYNENATEVARQWFSKTLDYKDSPQYIKLTSALKPNLLYGELGVTKELVSLLNDELKSFTPAQEKIKQTPYNQYVELLKYDGVYKRDNYYIRIDKGAISTYKYYEKAILAESHLKEFMDGKTQIDKTYYRNEITEIKEQGGFKIHSGSGYTFQANTWTCSWELNFSGNNVTVSGSSRENDLSNGVYTKIR